MPSYPCYYRTLVFHNETWLIAAEFLHEKEARAHAERHEKQGTKTMVEKIERTPR